FADSGSSSRRIPPRLPDPSGPALRARVLAPSIIVTESLLLRDRSVPAIRVGTEGAEEIREAADACQREHQVERAVRNPVRAAADVHRPVLEADAAALRVVVRAERLVDQFALLDVVLESVSHAVPVARRADVRVGVERVRGRGLAP